MNSIFVEISKRCILNSITKAIRQSLTEDKSLQTMARDACGCPRDIDLAKAKRKLLEGLEKIINGYKPLVINDSEALNYFREQLDNVQRENQTLSRENNKPIGLTGDMLENRLKFIQEFHGQLARAELLDVLYDCEPLHVFQYYVADYFAVSISLLHDAFRIHYPALQSRAHAREKLVVKIIAECKRTIEAFNPTLPRHCDNVQHQVTTNIDRLKTEDFKLVASSSSTTTLFFESVGAAHSDKDILIDRLDTALMRINELQNAPPEAIPATTVVETTVTLDVEERAASESDESSNEFETTTSFSSRALH